MIESRRCPRPQRRSTVHQAPDPSGPRATHRVACSEKLGFFRRTRRRMICKDAVYAAHRLNLNEPRFMTAAAVPKPCYTLQKALRNRENHSERFLHAARRGKCRVHKLNHSFGLWKRTLYSLSHRSATSYNAGSERATRLARVGQCAGEDSHNADWNTALEERSRHRYRQQRKRKKVKRVLKQLLVGAVSIGTIVIAVVFWRYLVA